MQIDTSPIQRFMHRVVKMSQLRQTDMRLSLAEASELSATLAAFLAHQVAQDDDDHQSAAAASSPSHLTRSVGVIDGGGLKSG